MEAPVLARSNLVVLTGPGSIPREIRRFVYFFAAGWSSRPDRSIARSTRWRLLVSSASGLFFGRVWLDIFGRSLSAGGSRRECFFRESWWVSCGDSCLEQCAAVRRSFDGGLPRGAFSPMCWHFMWTCMNLFDNVFPQITQVSFPRGLLGLRAGFCGHACRSCS